jgi:hypothetical protein
MTIFKNLAKKLAATNRHHNGDRFSSGTISPPQHRPATLIGLI